jgi:hypothetical protein
MTTTQVVKTGQMPDDPDGLLFVALGLVLMAVGFVWRGRVLRPLSVKRAQSAVIRDRSRNLLRSADMAIAEARRQAALGEPAEDDDTVAHVHALVDVVGDEQDVTCPHAGTRSRVSASLLRRVGGSPP